MCRMRGERSPCPASRENYGARLGTVPCAARNRWVVLKFTNPRTMLIMRSTVLCDWKVNEPDSADCRFFVVKPKSIEISLSFSAPSPSPILTNVLISASPWRRFVTRTFGTAYSALGRIRCWTMKLYGHALTSSYEVGLILRCEKLKCGNLKCENLQCDIRDAGKEGWGKKARDANENP